MQFISQSASGAKMPVGLLLLQLQIPGCTSLKEKRSRLKPLLARLHREFNISTCEMDHQDSWQEAVIACAMVSSDAQIARKSLQHVANWVETSWPDVTVLDDHLDIIS